MYKILIVEDTVSWRDNLAQGFCSSTCIPTGQDVDDLETFGVACETAVNDQYCLHFATTLDDGIRLLNRNVYDAYIFDRFLPSTIMLVADPLEAGGAIYDEARRNQIRDRIPIIFWSQFDEDPALSNRVTSDSRCVFVPKGKISTLRETVDRLLGSSKLASSDRVGWLPDIPELVDYQVFCSHTERNIRCCFTEISDLSQDMWDRKTYFQLPGYRISKLHPVDDPDNILGLYYEYCPSKDLNAGEWISDSSFETFRDFRFDVAERAYQGVGKALLVRMLRDFFRRNNSVMTRAHKSGKVDGFEIHSGSRIQFLDSVGLQYDDRRKRYCVSHSVAVGLLMQVCPL